MANGELSDSYQIWIGKASHAKVLYNTLCIHFQYDATANLPVAWLAVGMFLWFHNQ
jgi:hypothetical protein